MGFVEEAYITHASFLSTWKTSAKEESKPVTVATPPRTTLPRLQISHFSSKYEDWPAFKDLFTSLIINDTNISDVTRMHYLKTSLKGDAEIVVKNLPTASKNFKVVLRYCVYPVTNLGIVTL